MDEGASSIRQDSSCPRKQGMRFDDLVDDVLHNILESLYTSDLAGITEIRKLSWVNQSLRSYIQQTPSLWTIVSSRQTAPEVQEILKRSRDLGLTVLFMMPWSCEQDDTRVAIRRRKFDAFVTLLVRRSRRWERVYIEGECHLWGYFHDRDSPWSTLLDSISIFPRLREITFDAPHEHADGVIPNQLHFYCLHSRQFKWHLAPNAHVKLCNACPFIEDAAGNTEHNPSATFSSNLPLKRIANLSLVFTRDGYPALFCIPRFLHNREHLTRLELRFTDVSIDLQEGQLPGMEHLSICIPSLQHLSVSNNTSATYLLLMCRMIDAPILQTLTIDFKVPSRQHASLLWRAVEGIFKARAKQVDAHVALSVQRDMEPVSKFSRTFSRMPALEELHAEMPILGPVPPLGVDGEQQGLSDAEDKRVELRASACVRSMATP